MKREDVIRIAKEAGAWASHTEHAVPYYLTQFAKLVEQATLESAAKHFDERGKYADGSWSVGWYDPEDPGIILRALKTQGE